VTVETCSVTAAASPVHGAAASSPAPAAAVTGSWYGLLAIAREARQTDALYRAMRPVNCPQDGTLLITHPRAQAILHCPFCGYEPTGMDHP
jgi:hypothetical protein